MDSQLRSRKIQKAVGDGQDCAPEDADPSRHEPAADGAAAKGHVGRAMRIPPATHRHSKPAPTVQATLQMPVSAPDGSSASSIGIRAEKDDQFRHSPTAARRRAFTSAQGAAYAGALNQ